MTNLRNQTLPVLEKYLAAGGRIVALSPPAGYVDGRLNAKPAEAAPALCFTVAAGVFAR